MEQQLKTNGSWGDPNNEGLESNQDSAIHPLKDRDLRVSESWTIIGVGKTADHASSSEVISVIEKKPWRAFWRSPETLLIEKDNQC